MPARVCVLPDRDRLGDGGCPISVHSRGQVTPCIERWLHRAWPMHTRQAVGLCHDDVRPSELDRHRVGAGSDSAALWKVRGLTLGWGFATGGVDGFVGGMVGRMLFPERLFADGLALVSAILGALVAMLIARAFFPKERSPSA